MDNNVIKVIVEKAINKLQLNQKEKEVLKNQIIQDIDLSIFATKDEIKSIIIKDNNNNVVNQNASNKVENNSGNNLIIGRGNDIKNTTNSIILGSFIKSDYKNTNEIIVLGIRPVIHDKDICLAIGCLEDKGSTKNSNAIYHRLNNTYFRGLGGYDGKNNPSDCESLQKIIKDLSDRITKLENK